MMRFNEFKQTRLRVQRVFFDFWRIFITFFFNELLSYRNCIYMILYFSEHFKRIIFYHYIRVCYAYYLSIVITLCCITYYYNYIKRGPTAVRYVIAIIITTTVHLRRAR